MSFELGVLLGAYGGAQSFESAGSWDHLTSQTSFFVGQSEVHSSPGGGQLDIFSSAIAINALTYNFAEDNDAFDRWFPDITTHQLIAYGWNRINKATNSGQILFLLGTATNEFIPVPFTIDLERQRIEIIVTSADDVNIVYRRTSLGVNSFSLRMDDLLVAADIINLNPNWDYTENEEIIKHLHTTIGGQTSQFRYSNFFKFEIGLFAIPTSQANLINFWWDNKFNLVYSSDTSDTNLTYIVRLVNQSKPLDTFVEVNPDLLSGRLQLESITSKLVY